LNDEVFELRLLLLLFAFNNVGGGGALEDARKLLAVESDGAEIDVVGVSDVREGNNVGTDACRCGICVVVVVVVVTLLWKVGAPC
jgi:hypothetical protein